MICLGLIASLLGFFGGLSLNYSESLNDMTIRYDDQCGLKPICNVTFTPSVDLVNPKIYYRLENFYANHRNFVKSRSYKQLRGELSDNKDSYSI
jgi:hypothetical protein